MSIRVLLVDDLPLVRQCIQSLLVAFNDVEVVGEADNSEDAARLARELRPNVIILDQDLPGARGADAVRLLKRVRPDLQVIVMADRPDGQEGLLSIDAGASAYIPKDITPALLAGAVRSVSNGSSFAYPANKSPKDHLRQLIRDERRRRRREAEGLTHREMEILTELSKGSTDNEIASRFHLTVGTVKTHTRNILRKLATRNRTQAIAYAIRRGLIK